MVPAQLFRKEASQIIDEVTEVVVNWSRYAKEAGVFAGFAEEIRGNHRLGLQGE